MIDILLVSIGLGFSVIWLLWKLTELIALLDDIQKDEEEEID